MMTETARTFGALLRRYRAAAGLTQEEVAARSGLTPQAISLLERGARQRPHAYTIHTLAEVLGLTDAERADFAATAKGREALGVAPRRPRSAGARLSTRPPLVGRDQEMVLLERHLQGEGPPALLLAGEPGIGKSRLVQEAIALAGTCGWTVLDGGCQRRDSEHAYAPVLDTVTRYLGRQDAASLRAVLQGCAWLVRLLPELAAGPIEPLPAWTLTPEQERRLVFSAVGRLLANLAGPAGTLLVLDDLQWAGADALDLLVSLLRPSTTVPMRVIGAYRDTDVAADAPLSSTLADLAQAGLVRHHGLTPLVPADVERLLALLLEDVPGDGDALRERVVQRTGGVPFFVVSCAHLVRAEGADQVSMDAVPWDVAQGIRQRVALLPVTAREVLGAAAVLGRVVEPALLTPVVDQPEPLVLAALDAASRARLLVDNGSTYQFAHDLIHEVVAAEVGAARRLVLHRRVAETLEEQPAPRPIDLLAYHYTRSGAHGKAAQYLEQAGDHAVAQAAHAAAIGHFQEAVSLLERLERVGDAARMREKLGAVLLSAARYDEAVTVLKVAAQTYGMNKDLESEGRVTAQIGIAHSRKGTSQEGLVCVQPVLARLETGGPSHSLAALYVAVTHLYLNSDRLAEGVAVAERGVALAAAVGDAYHRARMDALRGGLLDMLGRTSEALQALEGAIQVLDESGQVYELCEALNDVAHIYVHLGAFEQSLQYLERAYRLAEQAQDREWLAFLTMHRGFITFSQGAWRQARRAGEQAQALCEQIGPSWYAAHPPMILGFVSYGEGHWGEATAYLEHSVALAERTPYHEALRMAQSVLAELDLRHGRPEIARDRLLPLVDASGLEIKDTAFVLPKLAWAYLDGGDHEDAARVAQQAVAFAHETGDHLNRVEALRVQALVAIRQEQWAAAETILREALALAHGLPYPWGEARVLQVYGDLHVRTGNPDLAQERLAVALAIFRRLGAQADAAEVERRVAALTHTGPSAAGSVPPRRRRPGPSPAG